MNEEQPIHPIYGYVFVTDREEGLVVVNVAPLLDGNPENNFLRRAKLRTTRATIGDTSIPDGKLTGAEYAVCAGHRVYVCTPRGLAVVDVNKPEQPAPRRRTGRRLPAQPARDHDPVPLRLRHR